jgi:hypothetical protein
MSRTDRLQDWIKRRSVALRCWAGEEELADRAFLAQ